MAKSKKPLTPYEQYKKQHKRVLQILRRYNKKEGTDVTPEELRKELHIVKPAEFKSLLAYDYSKGQADYYLEKMEYLIAKEVQANIRFIAESKEDTDYTDYDGWYNDDYPPEENTLNQAIIDMFTELFMNPAMPSGNPNFVMHKLKVQNTLKAIWEDTLDSTDPYALAATLEENAHTIKSVVERLQYASESADEEATDLSLIVEILNGGSPLSAEQADQINESAMWYGMYDNLRGGL